MERYSQKPLIELLKTGAYPGEITIPKHIETVQSNVFIFEKNVYKIYKNDADFFNKHFKDISEKEKRFSFSEADFQWNRNLCPEIYLQLAPVVVREGAIREVGTEEAEELVMVMNRVNTEDVLFEKLIKEELSKEDFFEIGKQLGENMKKVQTQPSSRRSFSMLFKNRIKDLRKWMTSTEEYFDEGEATVYCNFLDDFLIRHQEWFETTLTDEVTVDGDFHAQNLVYSGKRLFLIDTYPPIESWRLGHMHIALYRVGIYILGLTGREEFFETFLRGYEAGNGTVVDRSLDNVFLVYAAGIEVTYFYNLQKNDPSIVEPTQRLHSFLKKYFKSIS